MAAAPRPTQADSAPSDSASNISCLLLGLPPWRLAEGGGRFRRSTARPLGRHRQAEEILVW